MPEQTTPAVSASAGNSMTSATTTLSIDRVAVRVPPFMPTDPELWFDILERNFEAAGITVESTKYSYLCSNLDLKYAQEIRDLIARPPSDTPYSTTKAELLKRLNVSQEEKTRKLLETQVLGDQKPSQFLRHLRELARGSVNESVLKTLWIRHLPSQVQSILTVQRDKPLNDNAELADAIMETIRATQPFAASQIAAVAPVPQPASTQYDSLESMFRQVCAINAEMRQEVSEIRRDLREERGRRSRSQNRGRSASRGRSQSRSRGGNPDHCWYHQRFGASATKCRQPCTYAGNGTGTR